MSEGFAFVVVCLIVSTGLVMLVFYDRRKNIEYRDFMVWVEYATRMRELGVEPNDFNTWRKLKRRLKGSG